VYSNIPLDDDDNDDKPAADVPPDTSPFHLHDLIGVRWNEFADACGKRPNKKLHTKHPLLQTRKFNGACFAAVIESHSSESPSYLNIAVTGKDMSGLSVKVKASFRSVSGTTADMEIVHDDLAKKGPADDSGDDIGGGGGKRQKSSNSSNVHLEMNMKIQELFEHRRSDNTPPTQKWSKHMH